MAAIVEARGGGACKDIQGGRDREKHEDIRLR
jgi:hypothetical protein